MYFSLYSVDFCSETFFLPRIVQKVIIKWIYNVFGVIIALIVYTHSVNSLRQSIKELQNAY